MSVTWTLTAGTAAPAQQGTAAGRGEAVRELVGAAGEFLEAAAAPARLTLGLGGETVAVLALIRGAGGELDRATARDYLDRIRTALLTDDAGGRP